MSRCCAKQAACCHGAAILDKRRHHAVRCGNFGKAMELTPGITNRYCGPSFETATEPVIGRAFARPVGGLLRMRSSLLKHNNLMLRSERRERLEAWAASDSHIAHSRYASRRGCLPGTSPGLTEQTKPPPAIAKPSAPHC